MRAWKYSESASRAISSRVGALEDTGGNGRVSRSLDRELDVLSFRREEEFLAEERLKFPVELRGEPTKEEKSGGLFRGGDRHPLDVAQVLQSKAVVEELRECEAHAE